MGNKIEISEGKDKKNILMMTVETFNQGWTKCLIESKKGSSTKGLITEYFKGQFLAFTSNPPANVTFIQVELNKIKISQQLIQLLSSAENVDQVHFGHDLIIYDDLAKEELLRYLSKLENISGVLPNLIEQFKPNLFALKSCLNSKNINLDYFYRKRNLFFKIIPFLGPVNLKSINGQWDFYINYDQERFFNRIIDLCEVKISQPIVVNFCGTERFPEISGAQHFYFECSFKEELKSNITRYQWKTKNQDPDLIKIKFLVQSRVLLKQVLADCARYSETEIAWWLNVERSYIPKEGVVDIIPTIYTELQNMRAQRVYCHHLH